MQQKRQNNIINNTITLWICCMIHHILTICIQNDERPVVSELSISYPIIKWYIICKMKGH